MKFYKKLFVGKSVENKDEIINMLNNKISILNIYLICINNKNSKNLMEIMKSSEIFKSINKFENYTVIGIANGKNEAFDIVKNILQDWYKNYNDFSKFKFSFN